MRMRMVVGMPREIEEHGPSHPVVRVPRMLRVGVLVPTGADFLPRQPVMLNVIHRFQQQRPKERGSDEARQCGGTPDEAHPQHQGRLEPPKPHRQIVQQPALGPLLPQSVRTHRAPKKRPRQKPVQRLPRPGRRRILRRPDVAVVPIIVLHKKVHVQRRRQQAPRQALVPPVRPMPQLVRHIDAQNPAAQPHSQRQPHTVRPTLRQIRGKNV